MPVIQISKVIHCLGTSGELPDRLELGQLGFTTDTADVLIGAAGIPQVTGRKSYPYENLKILTELDVQKTMTGDVYHHGPLYSQELITGLGVMDVPLFKRDNNSTAQYGNYDYSLTSSETSQMGEIMVAQNGNTVNITRTANVWGLIDDSTFSFTVLMIDDQVMLRISWTPAALGTEIYKLHMAGREWVAMVDTSPDTPPIPKPLPTTIIDLSVLAQSPSTVLLTYTNAEGAIAHEYRINGGAIYPVPTGRLVTGLTPNTSYSFEVRGINANGNGVWSNVANATTPGVIMSYPDSYTIVQGRTLNVPAPGILINDTNAFGLTNTAELVTGPAHGTVSLTSNGGFSYTPFSSYSGSDFFTYRAWDGVRYGPTATVNLTVSANPVPVAVANSYSVNANSALNIGAPGVLGNDYDPNGDTITAELVTGVLHGTLTFNSNGSFAYTPSAGYSGADSFTYRVFDGVSYSSNTTVNLTVNAVVVTNTAPVAVGNAYTLNQNTLLTLSAPGLLINDSDADGNAISASLVSGPSHGVLGLNSNGGFTYTPSNGFSGTDSFVYRVYDGQAYSGNATVNLTINAVAAPNAPPTAAGNSYSVAEDQTLSIAGPGVLGNDSDPNSDPLTAILVTGPAHGNLSLSPNGSFNYTPYANYNGPDSFTYKASDGSLYSGNATVNITVSSVADPDTYLGITDTSLDNSVKNLALNQGVTWGIFPDGAVRTGTASATTYYETWLQNSIEGALTNPGAYEIRVSSVTPQGGGLLTTGMDRDVWYNLGTQQYIKAQNTNERYSSINYTVQIRPVGGSIITSKTVTLIVDTSVDGSPNGCVWTQAYLADNTLVGNAEIGHPLMVLDEDGWDYHADTIRDQKFVPQPCATIETESGITLTCSYSTPIAIRFPDGSINTIKLENCLGVEVPVLDDGEFRWETVTGLTDVGTKMVSLINVNDGVYAAGNEQNRFIFTHNMAGTYVDKTFV